MIISHFFVLKKGLICWSPYFSYPEYVRLLKNCSSNTTCPQLANFSDCCVHDPPLYYFYRDVLNISPSIEDLGEGMQWKLFGYLAAAWVVVYICVAKGIRSSGKVRLIYCWKLLLTLRIINIRRIYFRLETIISLPFIWNMNFISGLCFIYLVINLLWRAFSAKTF